MDGRQKNMLLGLGLFFIWFVIGFLILQSQLGEELLAFFAAAKLSIFCVTGIFAFLGIFSSSTFLCRCRLFTLLQTKRRDLRLAF